MLKALLSVQLSVFLSIFTGSARSKKKKSKASLILFSALMIYALGMLGFLFWHIFDTIAEPFSMLGLDWLFFTMAAIFAFAIMFIASVFTAKAQLFEAKDNERLLCMPIPPHYILLSRMLTLYILNFVLGLLVLIPALIVWSVGRFTPIGLLAFILEIFLLPLLGITVSSLFAWLISLLTSRLPKKNLVTTILYFVFFGAYMVVCTRLNTYLTELAGMGEKLASSLGVVAPLYWLGAAPAGDAPALLGTIAFCILPFLLLYFLISRSFISILTKHRSEKKVVYKEKSVEAKSPRKALLQKEFRHLLACPTWMLNGCFAPVILTVGAVVLLIKRTAITEAIGQIGVPEGTISVIVLLLVMAVSGMAPLSNCAISLEGRSFDTIRSFPVPASEVLYAKQRMAELINMIPAALFLLAANAALIPKTGEFTGLLLSGLWFVRLSVRIGLMEDLRHGRLDWVSEAVAVKQGMSVLFTMAINFGLTAVIAILWFALCSGRVPTAYFLCGVFILFIILENLIARWMKTKGEDLFNHF